MSIRLGRSLVSRGLLTQREADAALLASVTRGIHLVRALLDAKVVKATDLDQALARPGEPLAGRVIPDLEIGKRLPPGLSRRLLAVPLRLDPLLGEILVATIDPTDPHVRAEVAHHLSSSVRLVRATLNSIEEALPRLEAEQVRALPLGEQRPTRRTAPLGAEMPPVHQPSAPPPVERPTTTGDVPIPLLRKPSTRPRSVLPARMDDEPVLQLRNSKLPARPSRPALRFDFDSQAPPPESPRRPSVAPPPAPATHDLPLPDPTAIYDALAKASDVDEVTRAAMRGLFQVGRRVALFTVRQGAFEGRTCNVAFGDPEALRALRIPIADATVLGTALATGMYLGPVPSTPAHAKLLDVMEKASDSFAAVPAKAGNVPALLLVADDLVHTAPGTRRMGDLAGRVGAALLRVARERR